MKHWLEKIESIGNKLPHPVLLFITFCIGVIVLSELGHQLQWQVVNPLTQNMVTTKSLLSREGIAYMLSEAITNFIHFAPVGSALVAIIGIGIAERSGLLSCLLRGVVMAAPQKLLGFFVVLAGILSSVAADAGYVVLIPLAALLFKSAGRNPLIGLAAAFAGVSGGYSANLLITPNDAILAGITTEAINIVQEKTIVTVTANYWFKVVSGLVIALVGAWVTAYLEKIYPVKTTATIDTLQAEEKRGLKQVLWAALGLTLIFLWLFMAEASPLKVPGKTLTQSPVFSSSIVVLIAMSAAVMGIVYGYSVKQFKRHHDVIEATEQSMATMAGYIVLMFFAAQFVSYFNWTKLGVITSMMGAEWLQQIQLSSYAMMSIFVVLVGTINLIIGSSAAAWALLAPIFVPMFMLVGIAPELTQAAFRIGDSSTNILTPLMPYFGIVLAFAQQHQKAAGIGTIMAMMFPYAIAFMLSWTGLLLLWMYMQWPLGF